jgi:dolichol-phosphate mannosyltransferase
MTDLRNNEVIADSQPRLCVEEQAERLSFAVAAPELTIVIPTLNEAENVSRVVKLLDKTLTGLAWEVIFVDDDSRDGTAGEVRRISRSNSRVRCLQRIGRRGLSTAVIEGILASSAPFVAVMDGDLQHDETLLPLMLTVLKSEPIELVVGSRYTSGGSLGEWSRSRVHISKLAASLSRLICKSDIADPMSGFFMLRRELFESVVHRLSGQGFKILLDLLVTANRTVAISANRTVAIKELPYEFRDRQYGESKLDVLVTWEFLTLLADKIIGHFIPVRFALFALIGGAGLIVHLMVLWLCIIYRFEFTVAQALATAVAMTSNFFLNNVFTYYDQRLVGWRAARGLLSFYAVCSLGALANVGIASYIFSYDHVWWIAGISGVVIGSVWNYSVSSVFTWKSR